MKHSTALLLFCLTLATPLLGQDPDKVERKVPPREEPSAAGVTESGDADATAQKLANEGEMIDGKARPNVRSDLPRYCDLMGAVRPSPVAPGTTGTLNIIAILKGDGVITDTSSVSLDYPRQQGKFTLGEPIWPAPHPGQLAKAFLGRPVFEDTLVVSIPITVAADTSYNTHAVHVNVSAVLTQGSNGGVIGELKTQVNASVLVGPASPLLAVPGGARDANAASTPRAAGDSGKVGATNEVVRPKTDGAAVQGQLLPPTANPPEPRREPTPASDAPPPAEGGQSLMLMVGGGFAVLVLLVVLLARKK